MKPNFLEMTRKELRAYVLSHREDNEAFYAYVDKMDSEGSALVCPSLTSMDDLQNYPEFIDKLRQDSGRRG